MANAKAVDVGGDGGPAHLREPCAKHAVILLDLWSSSDEEASLRIDSQELVPDTPRWAKK